jgi:glycosyltransferase XagB
MTGKAVRRSEPILPLDWIWQPGQAPDQPWQASQESAGFPGADPACSAHIPSGLLLAFDSVPLRRTEGGVLVLTALDRVQWPLLSAWFPGERVVCQSASRGAVQNIIVDLRQEEIADEMANGFSYRSPELAAKTGIARWQKVVTGGFVLAITGLAATGSGPALVVLAGLVFSGLLLFKILLAVVSARHTLGKKNGPELTDDELPSYTILVPAYHEEDVIGGTVEWLAGLDYPVHKLEVLVLVERRDQATARAVAAVNPPDFVRIVWLPPGTPQTKPRSCNLGLMLARGDLLVIFDAEDRPEHDQLRKVAAQFAASGDRLGCVQAKLNFYNAHRTLLARMFSLEYAFWFDMMLPGMDRLRLPIPLGGTSNHLRTSVLREVGGWDAWNVTEDADLGIRLASSGYRVQVADSTTWEECPDRPWPWIRQRTRWLKGYLLTLLVHTRRPATAWRRFGTAGLTTLMGVVGGTPLAFMLWPVVFVLAAFSQLPGRLTRLGPAPVWLALGTMLASSLLMIVSVLIAGYRRRMPWWLAVLVPCYWLLHAFAGWRGLQQLVRAPYKWEKTVHHRRSGLTGRR